LILCVPRRPFSIFRWRFGHAPFTRKSYGCHPSCLAFPGGRHPAGRKGLRRRTVPIGPAGQPARNVDEVGPVEWLALAPVANDRAAIGEVDFTGEVAINNARAPLNSVNTVEDAAGAARLTALVSDQAKEQPTRFAAPDGITEITPDLGVDVSIPPATLVIAHRRGNNAIIDEVRTATTSVPALGPDQVALLGGGSGGDWLAQHATPGANLDITTQLSSKGIDTLIGGATVLVRDGAVFHDPTGAPPSGRNPETMVGVSKDGRRLTMVVIDGRQPATSIGVTPEEAAQYLVAHGVDSGLLLDGGGSSVAAARLPGTASLRILNHPSDATGERPVANGLFVYSRRTNH
jgi:Phosphodiester glycosidase